MYHTEQKLARIPFPYHGNAISKRVKKCYVAEKNVSRVTISHIRVFIATPSREKTKTKKKIKKKQIRNTLN